MDAIDFDDVDPAEIARYEHLGAAAFDSALAAAAVRIERDLAQGNSTPPLNLATLRTNWGVEKVFMDNQYAGDRITGAGGMVYLSTQPREYSEGVLRDCAYTASRHAAFDTLRRSASYPVFEALTRHICRRAAEARGAPEGLPVALSERITTTYAKRRRAELERVRGYLVGRIGFGQMISADEERAVMYLERLAAAAEDGDGPPATKTREIAQRAAAWRDDLIDRGAITEDLEAELAMRGEFARREATFRANERRAASEVAAKSRRTPAQRDSVWRDICASVGATGRDCPE